MNCSEHIREFGRDESGVGVVEIILILVVLISLVVLFKKQLTSVVNSGKNYKPEQQHLNKL